MSIPLKTLFVVFLVEHSIAYKYRYILENDSIFSKCANQPNNVLDVSGFIDRSNLSIVPDGDGMMVSGNATFHWDIQSGDRVQVKIYLDRFDRGSWQPTPFNIFIPDICKMLFDETQYWYKFWIRFVANKDVVRDKCFYPGVQHIFDRFDFNLEFETTGMPLSGRHKIGLLFQAFDPNGTARESTICLEIVGEFERF